ncbi:MAG: molybdenum cofactor guanylyltransferase [Chloroflexota bacterium]|nr:molybdenum cofactor guanylyltransferase [Chloroflexota bacterium]MCY3581780.1 molybdenum cofactor guanylyltransferase [Chloroflexota bacterium]MDE2651102.1 molybdenum cofactor guanylyltransferase [Chloroflexota bacterium]MXV92292.1 molybdenum cofactor guanylyltransferase [Chloroflexota bacterium]MXX51338.1 molybdenum cofactor guanylyltransferase [Chloroflexota bacterium]
MIYIHHDPFSLAIIAGGQSRRMGRDKAFLRLGGKTIIQRLLERTANLGQAETLLITNNPAAYAHLQLPMHGDALPGKGALGGIYTALLRATCPVVLALACDMPFVNARLLRFMLRQLDAQTDVVVPRVDGYPQSLHAIYRQTCLPPIRERLLRDRLKNIGFYPAVRVTYLDEADYAAIDPLGKSFTNLNTPAELEQARLQMEKGAIL